MEDGGSASRGEAVRGWEAADADGLDIVGGAGGGREGGRELEGEEREGDCSVEGDGGGKEPKWLGLGNGAPIRFPPGPSSSSSLSSSSSTLSSYLPLPSPSPPLLMNACSLDPVEKPVIVPWDEREKDAFEAAEREGRRIETQEGRRICGPGGGGGVNPDSDAFVSFQNAGEAMGGGAPDEEVREMAERRPLSIDGAGDEVIDEEEGAVDDGKEDAGNVGERGDFDCGERDNCCLAEFCG
jgi:hypothetical protein